MTPLAIKIIIGVLAFGVFLLMAIAPNCQDYLDDQENEEEVIE